MGSKAQAFREFYPQKNWANIVNSNTQCAYKGFFDNNYQFFISHNVLQGDVHFNMISPYYDFLVDTVYEVDLYFAGGGKIQTIAKALSSEELSIVLGNIDDITDSFKNIKEFSVGFDETFYVFNNDEYNIPVSKLSPCEGGDLENSYSDSVFRKLLGSFVSHERNLPQEDVLSEEEPGLLTPEALAIDNKAAVSFPHEDSPSVTVFDISEEGGLVVDEPQNPSYEPYLIEFSEDNRQSGLNSLGSESESASVISDDIVAFDNYDGELLKDNEIVHFTEMQPYSPVESQSREEESATHAQEEIRSRKNAVLDVMDLQKGKYPSELHHVRGYVNHKGNVEEDELVESLLVQLALLEREKEALRKKMVEQPSALSVIRSCKDEKERIAGLVDQLQDLEAETFDYSRQKEIDEDLLRSCEAAESHKLNNLKEDFDIEGVIVEDIIEPPLPPADLNKDTKPLEGVNAIDDVAEEAFEEVGGADVDGVTDEDVVESPLPPADLNKDTKSLEGG